MTKTLAITGGTRGIGRAIAEKFLTNGWHIAVCARGADGLQAMQADIVQKGLSGNLYTFVCDVTDREQLVNFYAFAKKELGTIDILVNNAGIFEPGAIQDEAEGVLDKLMQTNVHSAYHTCRLFLPDMIERKSGHIFNICSLASIAPYPKGASYTMSKYALYGMTKVMQEQLRPFKIKVTAVLPGTTLTSSWQGTTIPESRFIKPEDIAESIYTAAHLSPSTVTDEIILRPAEGGI